MSMKTVKVSNVSLSATQQDIREFFSFSGDIVYVEIKSDLPTSQVAYVTFKDSQGADTAVLLSGATIVDLPVNVTLEENYQLPPEVLKSTEIDAKHYVVVQKAEDIMSTMLAKGFVLGKDALTRAKTFDERHNITSNASATVASLDRRMGLSEKFTTGTTAVNEKVKAVDERYHVSQMTWSAFTAAEQRASSAGSAILSNPLVQTGASWVTSAFSKVAQAATEVGSMTKEKVEKVEEERKDSVMRGKMGVVDEYAQLHLDEPLSEEAAAVSFEESPRVVDAVKVGSPTPKPESPTPKPGSG